MTALNSLNPFPVIPVNGCSVLLTARHIAPSAETELWKLKLQTVFPLANHATELISKEKIAQVSGREKELSSATTTAK